MSFQEQPLLSIGRRDWPQEKQLNLRLVLILGVRLAQLGGRRLEVKLTWWVATMTKENFGRKMKVKLTVDSQGGVSKELAS